MNRPDLDDAELLVPATDNVLRNLNAAEDGLYVQELHDGIGRLLRVEYDTRKVEEIKLPFDGSVTLYSTDRRVSGAYIGMTGWTEGFRILAYDPAQRAAVDI